MASKLLLGGMLALALALLPGGAALAASTLYVDGVNGSDLNACTTPTTACKTIGRAIGLASMGDTINVAAATYPENVTIPISLTITGAGAATTIIDGGHLGTVVMIPNATSTVTLSDLTIRNGATGGSGGGINNGGSLTLVSTTLSGNGAVNRGGSIYTNGTLTLVASTLSGNRTGFNGGGIDNFNATAIVSHSIVSGNGAPGTGGGLENNGILIVSDRILSGNTASAGGGINTNTGTVTVSDSTLSGNSASTGGGGGIHGGGTLQDTIVANSPSGGNCSGTVTSNGHNLSSDATCAFTGPGDLINTDPKLGPLQFNGGPAPTQALLAGSPAIDAGDPTGCKSTNGALLTTDQRGAPRPDAEDAGVGCDIGAFELQGD